MSKIVVIEDERDIRELLKFNLERDGYEVHGFDSGETGLEAVREIRPDLIVLDNILPGMNGLDVCRAVRTSSEISNTPIIMLTAKNEDVDVVAGLEVGADDYVTKPFSYRILIARIRAVLRRDRQPSDEDGGETIEIGSVTIDPVRHRAAVDKSPVKLTAGEFKLLLTMARRPGWVFDRSQLIDLVKGQESVITDRTIDVMVAGIRKKLGKAGDLIETVRGVGYRVREF